MKFVGRVTVRRGSGGSGWGDVVMKRIGRRYRGIKGDQKSRRIREIEEQEPGSRDQGSGTRDQGPG